MGTLADASGEAFDAEVITSEDVAVLTPDEAEAARLEEGRVAGRLAAMAAAQDVVRSANAAVERAEAHLEGAKQAVAQAEAELAATEAEEVE